MKKLALNARTRHVLGFIRQTTFPLSVYGRSHARVMPMVRIIINLCINRSGPARHETNMYRRAAVEMVKAFRTLTGEPLARALELTLRKWINLGLKSELLQELLCDLHQKFDATGHQIPKPKNIVPVKRAGPGRGHKKRRTYEEQLKRGRVSLRPRTAIEDQAANFTRAVKSNKEISNRLAGLLRARRIPGQEFIRYNAFAQKLGRLARNYSSRSLAQTASDLIDLYEAKSLDRDTLASIAATLFGLTDLST